MTRAKTIRFLPAEKDCVIRSETSVLEVALNHRIEIGHSCGGMGSCTTCRVIVENSVENLPPRNELEQDIAEMRGFGAQERLSCQLPPIDGLIVRVPETLDGDLE